jgi:tRNA threonylcarbamoyladenosine biosynthesis protein TsaB
MKILAVNTATPSCGVAVVDEDTVSAYFGLNSRTTHARQLLPLIDETLKACRLTIADLDGFAAVRGPGSFTGLRIGISTVKGLALACDRPLVGVSSLDALAFPLGGYSDPICVMIDARKNEVYACWYRYINNNLEKLTDETVMRPEKAVTRKNGACLFVGTGAQVYRDLIQKNTNGRARFAPSFQNDINPEVVAHLAIRRFRENQTASPDDFAPVYIRPPDAVAARPAVPVDNR